MTESSITATTREKPYFDEVMSFLLAGADIRKQWIGTVSFA
jgi:hypothetical protein